VQHVFLRKNQIFLENPSHFYVITVSPGLTLQFRDYFQNSVEFKT